MTLSPFFQRSAVVEAMSMIHQARELRGIPIWLLKIYLSEIGGQETKPNMIQGLGWQISLTQLEDFKIGSIQVGQVRLAVTAESSVIDELNLALDKKLMRAGG